MLVFQYLVHPSVPGVFSLAAFIVTAIAFGDALLRPGAAWRYTGQRRPLWLAITGAAFAVTLSGLSFFSLLVPAALVGAIVYLVEPRPKLRQYRPAGRSGPGGGPTSWR